SGLWEDHIYEQHKVHIKNVGRSAAVTIDNRFKSFPRWSKVHHFEDGISKITFNDGSKNHDISKVRDHASFRFRYISQTQELDKNWNFIKLHYTRHCFDDIESKGVLRGLSTKPNEKFHGPLRKIYLRLTNFKGTAKQVSQISSS
ncbi:hypothetical protein GYMLUDRAFT_153130, partial [Collybiopsis luxurians FD-317 M1]